MPPISVAEPTTPSSLDLIIFSSAFDRVHYALTMAAASCAINRPTTLFFAMGAVRALLAKDKDGPGWRHLAPTEKGLSPLDADRAFLEKNLADFETLFDCLQTLGAVFMVCDMGPKAEGIDFSALRPDLTLTEGGLTSFLGLSKDRAIQPIFI